MNISPELRKRVDNKIAELDSMAGMLPCIACIHNRDLELEYLSPLGQKQLGHTLEQLKAMGHDYHHLFFETEEADFVPKVVALLKSKDVSQRVSYFQRVKFYHENEWVWHATTSQILMQDDDGEVLLFITFSVPIDPKHHLTSKVTRLLEENIFLRKNYGKFAALGRREKEVLQLIATGKSNQEVAGELFISAATVETHRRNIKQKLDAGSLFDLMEYARAFDLV
ncbi:response regulator transcription factor [Deminuibacter soli]|uniref:LuxR family transcriptional regulator n=1 Tax=Deminuibacter soli TaxID=2291815 RepID=A0A3E1NM00_9BACT|nr:helix-turn-helix transcriptional regulator [Deminuibacter soli]RFM28828.1 LuxR family transcriptional regulator [Deminuibacter soli]